MAREGLQVDGVATPRAPLSSVVVSGDLVFVAGQGGFDAGGTLVQDDFRAEVQQTLENLRLCLAAAGCGFDDVLRCGAYVVSLDDFPVFNEVYREHFSEPFPARTTIECRLAGGMRVEIDAVARRPGS